MFVVNMLGFFQSSKNSNTGSWAALILHHFGNAAIHIRLQRPCKFDFLAIMLSIAEQKGTRSGRKSGTLNLDLRCASALMPSRQHKDSDLNLFQYLAS